MNRRGRTIDVLGIACARPAAVGATPQPRAGHGNALPRVTPIEIVDGSPAPDEFGNVVGGLRPPFPHVPAGTWFGSATGAPFYPSRTARSLLGTHPGWMSSRATMSNGV